MKETKPNKLKPKLAQEPSNLKKTKGARHVHKTLHKALADALKHVQNFDPMHKACPARPKVCPIKY